MIARHAVPLALALLALAPLAAAAAVADPLHAPAPDVACFARPLPFPANPFDPSSPAGQLYAGATGTANVAWLFVSTSPCLVAGVVNVVCVAETGHPCLQ
jgi:hypothetical protein